MAHVTANEDARIVTCKASADLRNYQYQLVAKVSGAWEVEAVDNVADVPLGILYNKPNTNEEASVLLLPGGGIAKGKAGGAVTEGAYLKTDNTGKFVVSSSDGEQVVGRALEAADSGDIFALIPMHFLRGA